MNPSDGGDVMWAQHLDHLRQIAIQRHLRIGREPHGYILWSICELDVQACLLGNGRCEFFSAIMQHNMLPSLQDQLPSLGPSAGDQAFTPEEMEVLPPLLRLRQGVLAQMASLAFAAQQCRAEAAARQTPASPGTHARWQALALRIQTELHSYWTSAWPDFLGPETAHAGRNLPGRARYVFEHVSPPPPTPISQITPQKNKKPKRRRKKNPPNHY